MSRWRKGIPEKILDFLQHYGGWRTTHGIALEIRESEDSVHRALFRMRNEGLITSRDRQIDPTIRHLEWRVDA